MKKIIFVFLIIGLGISGIWSEEIGRISPEKIQSEINKTTSRRKLRKLYWQLGNIYLETKRPQEAVVNFLIAKEYADRPKDRYPILRQLATIYYQLNDYHRAIDTYQQADLLYPKNVEVKYLLALIYQQIGRADLAETLYQRILQIDRNQWPASVFLGDIEQQRGFYSRAIDCYQQALLIKKKQNLDIYNRLASTYELSGDYPTAKKLWQDYLATAADSKAYLSFGKIAWRHGDYHLAVDSFSRYLTREKNDQEGLLWLGLSYLKLDKLSEAENIFLLARGIADDGPTNFCLALLYQRQGNREKFQECRQKALASSSAKIQNWLKMYLK